MAGLTAEDRIRIIAELDNRGLIKGTAQYKTEMLKMQAATLRANKAIRNQGQSFNQLAYIVDDIQYGFRGIQNNLQQLAITSGASGPVVLGITLLTVALGKFLEKAGESDVNVLKLAGDIKKLNGEIETLQGQIYGENETIEDKIAKKWDEILNKQAKYVGIILGLQSAADVTGFGAAFKAFREAFGFGDDDINETAGNIVSGSKEKEKDVNAARNKRRLKELKKANNEYFKDYFENVEHQLRLDKIYGATKQQLYQQEIDAIVAIDTSKLDQDQIDALQKRIEILQALQSQLEGVTVTSKKTKDETAQLNDQFSSIAAGGIADFASALGESLVFPENLGKNLLSGIGKLMVAFGTALVAWGVGWKFFKDAPKDPVGTIIAGGVLIAAGAAISAVASKAKGYGGGSAGSGSPSISVTPTSTQGAQGGSQLVATVRGQDLRFALQSANDIYSGIN